MPSAENYNNYYYFLNCSVGRADVFLEPFYWQTTPYPKYDDFTSINFYF